MDNNESSEDNTGSLEALSKSEQDTSNDNSKPPGMIEHLINLRRIADKAKRNSN